MGPGFGPNMVPKPVTDAQYEECTMLNMKNVQNSVFVIR